MKLSPLTQALIRDVCWNVVCAEIEIRRGSLRPEGDRFSAGMVRADLRHARLVMGTLRDTCPARYRTALAFARSTLPELRQKLQPRRIA